MKRPNNTSDADLVKETIGKNIRTYRQDMGLSQRKLAAVLDMDHSYLGRIEAGKCNISIDTVVRIAESLNVSFFDLVK